MRSQSSLALAPKAVQIGKTADLVRLVRIVRTFLHAKLTWRRHTRLRVSGGTRLLHHGTMARCARLIPRKGTAFGAYVLVANKEMRSPRRESSFLSHVSPKTSEIPRISCNWRKQDQRVRLALRKGAWRSGNHETSQEIGDRGYPQWWLGKSVGPVHPSLDGSPAAEFALSEQTSKIEGRRFLDG
jgi:hypothetical protein